ncbi:MAG: bifunctional hydroxymethylpyrimidine kinase/phosphomethylpyrimidine kinase [bacterium]|nr:MAG: bifunctional hydroxymethylpyrimidine kinase/phosphomethylpyrimidine kinase [bacterium]
MTIKKALTIAGSDSGGGAGIQADLKTFSAFGVYGMSAITALTAQNTIGVQSIQEIPAEFIQKQIESIMTDIGTDAAKTGMLANQEIVGVVAEAINSFHIPNLVVDPVMVAKSGDHLLAQSARIAMKEKLIPLAEVITPNIFEAEALVGYTVDNLEKMKQAARDLHQLGCRWVVIKGGHISLENQSMDVVFNGSDYYILKSVRFDTRNTHGTGCTFASAIAASLAKEIPPLEAIKRAKDFITEAIRSGLSIGSGHGPTNHLVGVHSKW